MRYRNELEKRIEKEKVKILELRSQLDRAEAFVLGLQEALRLIPKDSELERKPELILRTGSDMAKVRDILKESGKPMYINEILEKLGKEVSKANRESIGGSIGNYARRAEIFTRTAPNTFGLIEFDELSTEDIQDSNIEEIQESEQKQDEIEKPTTLLSRLPKLSSISSPSSNINFKVPDFSQNEKDDDVPW